MSGISKFPGKGAISIQPKILKFSKRGQMVIKFPRDIQIPEISGQMFSKIWVYLTRLSSFSEIM